MVSTGIEYGQVAWNPVTGCSPISEGCQNCWAQRMSKRQAGRNGYPADEPFKVTLRNNRLTDPYRWQKQRMVLVSFMGDLFHEDIPFLYLAKVFGTMHTVNRHTYLVLTKRPDRMAAFFNWFTGPEWRGAWPHEYPHVWLGVTTENQARADERIPILLQIPAAKRFVSIEPMLGPVDLTDIGDGLNPLATIGVTPGPYGEGQEYPINPQLDWVICGGESGPAARQLHPDWARRLRDQCVAASTPFYFKQWGEYCFPEQMTNDTYREVDAAVNLAGHGDYNKPWKVGKKKAGRLLDGQEWSQMPGVSA